MHSIRLKFLFALTVTLICAEAFASLNQRPVKVRLVDEPQVLAKGATLDATLELTAGRDGTLSGLTLKQDGWTLTSLSASGFALKKGAPTTFHLKAIANDPARPLVFLFLFDGAPSRAAIDLSPVRMAKLVTDPPLAPVDDNQVVAAIPQSLSKPDPAPLPSSQNLSFTGPTTKVTAHGRLVYLRKDGKWLGVDGATIGLYDSVLGLQLPLGTVTTDSSGRFSIDFNWPFCGLCRNPNVFVRATADNAKLTVRPPGIARAYSWRSSAVSSGTATDIDLGALGPDANAQAMHILTVENRAWRYLKDHQSYDLDFVEVWWPDDENGTSYSGAFQEIYVETDDEWREESVTHEYMHHWAQHYSSHEDPDYCNNSCDADPNALIPDCSHCPWCAETDHDAFSEGIADWFSDFITRSVLGTYGVAPLGGRTAESLSMCFSSNTLGNPALTEGPFHALLADIEDSAQDADPASPGQIDALALGPDPIFKVADLYDTRTPLDFINKFKSHFPALPMQLWKTSANNGYFVGADPCRASVNVDRWRGEYFRGKGVPTDGGVAIAVREENQGGVFFDWGNGSPFPECGVPVDDFTVVWTKRVTTDAAPYRLVVTADDGVRVWIDANLVLDQWQDQPATTWSLDYPFLQGTHDVRVEYFEHGGGAVAKLSLTPICSSSVPAGRWKGEYFASPGLAGAPVLVRDDTSPQLKLDRNFGAGSPSLVCGVPSDNFSARFTRSESFDLGMYRFSVTADDGVRLYVDNALTIDRWVDQPPTTFTADVQLSAGTHTTRIEYYEHGAGAVIQSAWTPICKPNVPLDHWQGEYFDNPNLQGVSKLVRDDGAGMIAYDWGNASPSTVCGVPTDGFSARFSRRVTFDGTLQHFTAQSYDGIRARLDGQLLFNDWTSHAQLTTLDAYATPSAGVHDLVFETFDLTGVALATFRWSRP